MREKTDKFAYGDNVQVELTGGHIKGGVFEFAPAIDQYLKEHLFADIFARGILTNQKEKLQQFQHFLLCKELNRN